MTNNTTGQERALREALDHIRSELALFAACCAVSNKTSDTFVGTEAKAKEWVAYINDALAQSPTRTLTARDLFEVARPCFHYAKRGTPDGDMFERGETGRLLMNAMEKIAALTQPEPVDRKWFPHLDFSGDPMREGCFREPYPMAEEMVQPEPTAQQGGEE